MTPRCPFCNAQGISQIEANPIGPALLIFCKKCGAIHGVVPKATTVDRKPEAETIPTEAPPAPPAKPEFKPKPLEEIENEQKDQLLTPNQAFSMLRGRQQGTMYKRFPIDDGEGS